MHTRTYVYDTYVCIKIRTTYIESVRFGRYNTHTQRYFLSFLLLSPTLIPIQAPFLSFLPTQHSVTQSLSYLSNTLPLETSWYRKRKSVCERVRESVTERNAD